MADIIIDPERNSFFADLTAYSGQTPTYGDQPIQCEICYNPYDTEKHKPMWLDCGHIFGLECLHEWLRTAYTCPGCRRRLFGPDSDEGDSYDSEFYEDSDFYDENSDEDEQQEGVDDQDVGSEVEAREDSQSDEMSLSSGSYSNSSTHERISAEIREIPARLLPDRLWDDSEEETSHSDPEPRNGAEDSNRSDQADSSRESSQNSNKLSSTKSIEEPSERSDYSSSIEDPHVPPGILPWLHSDNEMTDYGPPTDSEEDRDGWSSYGGHIRPDGEDPLSDSDDSPNEDLYDYGDEPRWTREESPPKNMEEEFQDDEDEVMDGFWVYEDGCACYITMQWRQGYSNGGGNTLHDGRGDDEYDADGSESEDEIGSEDCKE